MINAWANFAVRFRWAIVLLVPFLVLMLSAPAANIYFAHSPDMWFLKNDPVNQTYQRLKSRFGDTQYLLVAISKADDSKDIIDAETLPAIYDIHNFLAEQEQVANVHSLKNYQYIRSTDDVLTIHDLFEDVDEPENQLMKASQIAHTKSVLSDEEIILGDLITEDFKHTVIVAETFYKTDGRVDHHVSLVNSVQEFIDVQEYKGKGFDIHVFGRPYISHQLTSGNIKDQMTFYPLMLLATLILLFAVFRRVRPMFVPWLLIICAVMIVYTVQGLMEWPTTVANASMPFLVIILAVGMSVHVMADHYRHLAEGMDGKEAARATIRTLFVPTFYTTLTTVFGFVGLSMTYLEPLRQYGILAIVGIVSCFLFSMLMLPALMSFAKKPPKWAIDSVNNNTNSVMLTRIGEFVVRQYKVLLKVGAAIAVLSIALTASLKMDTNFVKIFKEESGFRTAFNYFDQVFQGGQAIEIMIDSGEEGGVFSPRFLNQVDEMSAWLDTLEETGKPSSMLGFVKQMNQSLNGDDQAFYRIPDSDNAVAQLILLYENSSPERGLEDLKSIDNRYLRVSLRSSNMSAVETQEVIERIRHQVRTEWPDLKIEMTGDLILFNKLENHIASGMIISFSIALLTIGLCLFSLFRRFGHTMIALIPSVFPIFVAGGVMKLAGIYPDINTLIIASVTIGIAVDDTIHFMIRYDRARDAGKTPEEAINISLNTAGKAIMLSTLILAAGFSVFAFSSLMSGVYFGLLSVVVIVFAFIGDILFLPAMLLYFEKRKLLRRDTEAEVNTVITTS